MDETFLTFQIFTDGTIAEKFAARLDQCKIPYKMVYDSLAPDSASGDQKGAPDVRIKIMQKDFPEAYKELADYYKGQPRLTDNDYYLYDCSDEELMEIIDKPNEWDQHDLNLAKKILKKRGKEIQLQKNNVVRSIKADVPIQKKVKKPKPRKSKPRKANKKWLAKKIKFFKSFALPERSVLLGYLAAVLIAPLGIYIGWTMAYGKNIAPDGQVSYAYEEEKRGHGGKILIISLIITIALIPILITKW
jgi:hypothetical protein